MESLEKYMDKIDIEGRQRDSEHDGQNSPQSPGTAAITDGIGDKRLKHTIKESTIASHKKRNVHDAHTVNKSSDSGYVLSPEAK